MRFLVNILLVIALCGSSDAFISTKVENGRISSSSHVNNNHVQIPSRSQSSTATKDSSLVVMSETKKKGGLDGNLRNKLLTESIAPWRTIRLFLYGALGSGAFIGGWINLSGAVAGSSSPDFNLNTELTNIGIDFGAVALFAVLAKFDLDKQQELQSKVDEKVQKKKELKIKSKGLKDREKLLRTLPVEIVVSLDGATREANVGELQIGAKQHMIIVIGPRKACKDALIGANLLKMDFAMSNVMVVPYETDLDSAEVQSRPSGGFGDKPIYEKQPYIARPTGEDWKEYVKQEMEDAIEQNGISVKEDGIAIVVASNGKIIRRGIGKVPWRQMVDELEREVNPSNDSPIPWVG